VTARKQAPSIPFATLAAGSDEACATLAQVFVSYLNKLKSMRGTWPGQQSPVLEK
jgi:hypothetical protein